MTHDGQLEDLNEVEDVDVPVFNDDAEVLFSHGRNSECRPSERESSKSELCEKHGGWLKGK